MPAALHEVHKHEDKFTENAAQAGAVNEGTPSTTLLATMVISLDTIPDQLSLSDMPKLDAYPPPSWISVIPSQDRSSVASLKLNAVTGVFTSTSALVVLLPVNQSVRMAFLQLLPILECPLTHTPDSRDNDHRQSPGVSRTTSALYGLLNSFPSDPSSWLSFR